jgi:signal peptidase I
MADPKKKADAAEKPKGPSDPILANRETVESVIVAVILALLFRAFVAEAFVIPTGSMAPTLMGRHVDVWCDECGYHYEGGASAERTREDKVTGVVAANARCPNCGYRKDLDHSWYLSNEWSFSGDRIIVSKYAYEMGDPQRWDVIVFKFPGEAQTNYIKRLIGLPGEIVRIHGGNIYTKRSEEENFSIARKPDAKLLALLQIVHDSDYPAATLQKSGWPARWQAHSQQDAWKSDELGQQHSLTATEGDTLLRYHHVDPNEDDWNFALDGQPPRILPDWPGRLISDFYAYNCTQLAREDSDPSFSDDAFGQYWVDDLALECEVELGEATGEVVLDLVRGGAHYTCRIDAKTGQATLAARGATGTAIAFSDGQKHVVADTAVKGAGKHRLRMSNVDHEVRLWVDGWRVNFDGPTAYDSEPLIDPDVRSADGDRAPIGVGGNNQAMTVRHLRVLRDKYYVACRETMRYDHVDEYQYRPGTEGERSSVRQEITYLLANPEDPRLMDLLQSRRHQDFTLGEDHFLPLGDNSPASADGRYWPDRNIPGWDGPYVERNLLVGKALFIYWPHAWNWPPLLPNFRKMQPIR